MKPRNKLKRTPRKPNPNVKKKMTKQEMDSRTSRTRMRNPQRRRANPDTEHFISFKVIKFNGHGRFHSLKDVVSLPGAASNMAPFMGVRKSMCQRVPYAGCWAVITLLFPIFSEIRFFAKPVFAMSASDCPINFCQLHAAKRRSKVEKASLWQTNSVTAAA